MKKTLLLSILLFVCAVFNIEAQNLENGRLYYPMQTLGFNGSLSVFNDGNGILMEASRKGLYNSMGWVADYVTTLDNGDLFFRNTFSSGKTEFRVSSDRKHYMVVQYNVSGGMIYASWYTDSKEEQQQYYAVNKNNQVQGITFDFTWDNPSSSSRSKSSAMQKSGVCKKCSGTGWLPERFMHATGNYYFNAPGELCSICGLSDKHYHYRCYH